MRNTSEKRISTLEQTTASVEDLPTSTESTFHGVAEIGGNTGDDECEEETLDDTHPHKPLVEGVLQSQGQVIRREDMSDECRTVGTDDTRGRDEKMTRKGMMVTSPKSLAA